MKTTGALSPTQFHGLWQLALLTPGGSAEAPVSTSTLQFERRPEYCDSVRDNLHRSRQAVQALLSGDAIGGSFSPDGSAMNFLLKKASSWR